MKSKKSFAVIFLIIIIAIAGIWFYFIYKPTNNAITGEWKYNLRDVYSFDDDNNFEIRIDNALQNYGEYIIDTSKDPVWIDIIPKKEKIFANHYTPTVAKGILRFQNPSVAEIALKADNSFSIFGGDRPESFDGDDILLISLVKIKPSEMDK